MIRLASIANQSITRNLAERFLDMPEVEGERPIRESRLKILREEIERNELIAFRWVVARINGIGMRVNGKHTSYLFSNGTSPPAGATAVIETYDCDTIEDVKCLWSKFDSQVSSRDFSENVNTFIAGNRSYDGTRPWIVKLVVSGIMLDLFGTGSKPMFSPSQKLNLLHGHEAFTQWLDSIIRGRDYRILKRSSVVCAMIKMFYISIDDCDRFWKEIILDTGEAGSCTRELRNILSETNSGKKVRIRKQITPHELIALCILYWNRWRDGLDAPVRRPSTDPQMELPKAT